VKLVGFLFDEKMTWAGMIAGIAKKARQRIGMLTRLRPLLDDQNMETMYTTFIRPVLEYGSIQFMGAADTHLHKLDAVQRTAERIGRFQVESLQSRREAAAISLTFKLLDGRGRGVLKNFVPTIIQLTTQKVRSVAGVQDMLLAGFSWRADAKLDLWMLTKGAIWDASTTSGRNCLKMS
jgi:hypothetical protein